MEKYKITKAIRFKLEAIDASGIQEEINTKNNDFVLADFVLDLSKYICGLYKYLFYQKNGEDKIKDKMTIKNEWLRQYAKQELIEHKEANDGIDENRRRIQHTFKDFDKDNKISDKIINSYNDIVEIYSELADDASKSLNERAKRAKTGLLLKRLQARNALPLLMLLLESTTDKNETNDLSISLKRQSQKIKSQLLYGIEKYLPEQSNGIPVAKASFNYYIINKKHVEFTREKQDLKKQLNVDLDKIFSLSSENFSSDIKQKITADIQKQLKDNMDLLLGDAPMLDIEDYVSLRQNLKNIKAAQKAKFNELMTQNLTFQILKNNTELYLFSDILEKDFNEYKNATNEIEKKAAEINQCADKEKEKKKKLRSDLQILKNKRGSLINAADKNNKQKFKTYKSFANFYRTIAQKHGKLLSKLMGIEKEQTESQLLKYWSLILEENNQHKLVLIPKRDKCSDYAGECHGWLNNHSKQNSDSYYSRIYWFESLTYRSLQKLCFGNLETKTNTFNEHIVDVLNEHKYDEINKKEIKITGEFSFGGDEQKKINFYKDVLASDYAQKVLNFPKKQVKEKIIDNIFATLDEFQIALEKICYCRYIDCSNDIKDKLQACKAQIFALSSLDLDNPQNVKDKKEKYQHFDKNHTSIWKTFWTDRNEKSKFDIRLNPEITITYRKSKPNRVDKYGEESGRYDKNKKNRYLYPQFTLVTTISEHSNSQTKDLSFITDEEFKESIGEFNGKLKREYIKFAFGIDNGETELSTLGVYLPAFDKQTDVEKIAELKKVQDYGFKTFTITDLSYKENDINGKERKIVENPSYFLNKELYRRTFSKTEIQYNEIFKRLFNENYLLTLDLTTAKVINGQIVTNGDVSTHYQIRLKNAQRWIYDMNDHIKKETAKKITLKNNSELNEVEKLKFIEYLNTRAEYNSKEYDKLNKQEKEKYTQWIFSFWDNQEIALSDKERKKFEKVKKGQRVGCYSKDILFAVCYIGKDIQNTVDIVDVHNVFKLRKEFDTIKTEQQIRDEINSYNIQDIKEKISNEELDLKINHLKQAVVANAVGVIDFLYAQYKERFGGEGLIVKEGFDTTKVKSDLEKFSGNIYRILEKKLYQKFQNYGLVPPIKNLMSVRAEGIEDNKKDDILRLGNIGFVSKADTSQKCPVCLSKLHHTTICPNNCGFNSEHIMHSNDGIAGYNIAKRGFENFKKAK
jgi:hypothetical protein